MALDLENPLLLCFHSDVPTSLFLLESDHMPSNSYLRTLQSPDFHISIRQSTVSLISQFCCSFDPLLSYLANNYLDRFLSSHGFMQPKQWVLRLLALSCISLAAKMTKTELSLTDFQGQGEGGFIFDTQTIQRMEVLILGALKWRMRSITPFAFIPFFISFFKLKDPPLTQALKARATEIIFTAQNETKLMMFKPSLVAASALLSASHELFPLQYPSFTTEISNCLYLNKENMLECFNVMQEIVISGYESVFDVDQSVDTPVNVLEYNFSSSESESTIDTTTTITASKKRKISDYCNNQTVQISQVQ